MTGEELRKKRKKFGLTQQDLASQLGISYATISRWEREEYQLNPAYEAMIRNFFYTEEKQRVQQIDQQDQRVRLRWGTIGESLERELFKGLPEEETNIVRRLLEEAMGYYPSTGIQPDQLQAKIQRDSQRIQNDITSDSVDGGTMLKIRSNTIASAILEYIQDTKKWSTEGLNRCHGEKVGAWIHTEPEWRWITQSTEHYIELVRKIKKFLNHITARGSFDV
jgi:transcriptional regulator with XRE-family HTH domain